MSQLGQGVKVFYLLEIPKNHFVNGDRRDNHVIRIREGITFLLPADFLRFILFEF
jgi:hypothetical protein